MGFRKRVAMLLVAGLLSGMMPGAALANSPTPSLDILRAYGIVKGDETGNLHLDRPITRAEMMAVLVRAAGKEELANFMQGAPSFPDVAPDAWYSGTVALAKSMGLTVGYEDGTFRPNNPVTYGEAFTLIARMAGLQPTSDPWPQNYIVPVVAAGVVPEHLADVVTKAKEPGLRGAIFEIAENAFTQIKDENGKSVLQRNIDSVPPTLYVEPVAPTSQMSVTIKGRVEGDAERLTVRGEQVFFGADGSFEVIVPVSLGENEIVIEAADRLGNTSSTTVKVVRTPAEAAELIAPDSVEVKAGVPLDLGIEVRDTYGAVIENPELTITASVEDLIEQVNGQYVAGKKVQEGTITVTVGNLSKEIHLKVVPGDLAKLVAEKVTVAPGKFAELSVKGYDAFDNAVENAEVVFELAGVSKGKAVVADNLFMAEEPGTYKVIARAKDNEEVFVEFEVGVYGETERIGIVVPDQELVANTVTDWYSDAYVSGKLYDVTFQALDKNGHVNMDENDLSFDLPTVDDGVVFYAVDEDGEVDTSRAITSGTFKNGVFHAKMGVLSYWAGEKIELIAYSWDSDIKDGKYEFKAVAPKATGLAIEDAPEVVATNDGGLVGTIKVRVVDQTGEPMDSGDYEAKVTVTGPATINNYRDKSAEIDIINGEGTFDLYAEQGETGEIKITVTAKDLKSAEHTVQAVIAGKATKFAVKITDANGNVVKKPVVADGVGVYTVTIQAVDSKGVPTTSNLPDEVEIDFGKLVLSGLEFDGDPANPAPTVLPLYDGVGTFTISSTSFVGELKFVVKAEGYQSTTASLTFVAGDPTELAFTHENARIHVPIDNPKVQLTVQLKDVNGNPVRKSGVEVTLVAKDESGNETTDVRLNGRTRRVTVKTDAKGQATVTVETIKYPTSYTIEATADGLTSDSIELAIVTQIVSRVNVYLLQAADTTKDATQILAGDPVKVKVVLEDQYRRPVSGMAEYLRLKVGKIIWDADSGKLVDNTEDTAVLYEFSEETDDDGNGTGVYWLVEVGDDVNVDGPAEVLITKAGLQNVYVEYTGNQNILTGRDTITVKAGSYTVPVVLKNGEIITEDTVQKNRVAGPYTLRLTDGYGNFVSVSPAVELPVISGTIRATATGANVAVVKTSSAYNFYFSPTVASGEEVLSFLVDDRGTSDPSDDVTLDIRFTVK